MDESGVTCQCGDANAHWSDITERDYAKPILVTGFEAFGEHETNVSQSVAESLASEVIRGHVIQSLTLSVIMMEVLLFRICWMNMSLRPLFTLTQLQIRNLRG